MQKSIDIKSFEHSSEKTQNFRNCSKGDNYKPRHKFEDWDPLNIKLVS